MLHGFRQHKGDGFNTAMRMPRKPLQVMGGHVVAKIIKQQERIQFAGVLKSKGPVQMYAGPSIVGWALRVSRVERNDMFKSLFASAQNTRTAPVFIQFFDCAQCKTRCAIFLRVLCVSTFFALVRSKQTLVV